MGQACSEGGLTKYRSRRYLIGNFLLGVLTTYLFGTGAVFLFATGANEQVHCSLLRTEQVPKRHRRFESEV